MEFIPIKSGDILWNNLIEYAKSCSWKAGSFLAKKMEEDAFTKWERIFIIREGKDIVGYCTFTEKDCIPNVSYSPYIGFLFIDEKHRGKRLSEQLIQVVLTYSKEIGFSKVFLVSGEKGLYEKYGFVKIDEKKDFWGNDEQIFCIDV